MPDIKYYDFIKNLPLGQEPDIMQFKHQAIYVLQIPDTDDIKELARFLYLKLDREMTLAFQKSLMMWLFVKNDFQQPKDTYLEEINHIIELQNNDPDYPY